MENIQPYTSPINNKQTYFFNGAEKSSELCIAKATEGKIGFLDLYAYNEVNQFPKEEQYHEEYPEKKIVHVGIEFAQEIYQLKQLNQTKETEETDQIYFINCDAIEFMERVKKNSVEIVNIDFPLFENKFIRGNLTDNELTHLTKAKRILESEGKLYMILSLCNFNDELQKEKIKTQIEQIGYKDIKFSRTNDFLSRTRWYSGYEKLISITAIKK